MEDMISLYGFADDHSIRKDFIAVKNDNHKERETILMLEKCLGKIKMWMGENRLKMNCSKTELILLGSRQQVQKCVTTHINVYGDEEHRSNIIKYLGAWMVEQLTVKQHITNKCRLAMYNVQKIKLVRPMLTENATKTILLGTVISHLDYVNGIPIGLSDIDYKKLQHVQNIAAKLVIKKAKTDSATECLNNSSLASNQILDSTQNSYPSIQNSSSAGTQYLQDLIKPEMNNHGRSMRSINDNKTLYIPGVKRKTFANRSFSVQGPKLWNMLPNEIRKGKNSGRIQEETENILL